MWRALFKSAGMCLIIFVSIMLLLKVLCFNPYHLCSSRNASMPNLGSFNAERKVMGSSCLRMYPKETFLLNMLAR